VAIITISAVWRPQELSGSESFPSTLLRVPCREFRFIRFSCLVPVVYLSWSIVSTSVQPEGLVLHSPRVTFGERKGYGL